MGNTAEKKQLLGMPEGCPKPSKKTQLGQALRRYTDPKSKCYDREFAEKIQAKQPKWFISQSDIANEKKQFLSMPEGCPGPSRKTQLGKALYNYTNPKSSNDNKEFTEKIHMTKSLPKKSNQSDPNGLEILLTKKEKS